MCYYVRGTQPQRLKIVDSKTFLTCMIITQMQRMRYVICEYINKKRKNIKNVKRCRDGMPKVCKQGGMIEKQR